jgi:hypothetical protein
LRSGGSCLLDVEDALADAQAHEPRRPCRRFGGLPRCHALSGCDRSRWHLSKSLSAISLGCGFALYQRQDCDSWYDTRVAAEPAPVARGDADVQDWLVLVLKFCSPPQCDERLFVR